MGRPRKAIVPASFKRHRQAFNEGLKAEGITVATGKFGADMQVALVNDGPVTIVIDTKEK